ncbi:MAG: hypothetical protein AB1461_10450 [Thermodesulfobacteriota bacterium]
MRRKKAGSKWGQAAHGFVLMALTLLALCTGQPEAVAGTEQGGGKMFSWQLQDAEVVSRGETLTSSTGILTKGYVVEALAVTSQGKAPVRTGRYTVDVTAFSPAKDLPGQKAGVWYVRGTWTLTDQTADEEELKAHHNPGTIKGFLDAELPFNPLTDGGAFDAQVRVPMAPGAAGWAAGDGTFTGNERFEGTLNLNLKKLSRSQRQGGAL